jgi:hypothetical protein
LTLPSAKAAGFSIHPTSASCKRIDESNSLYALYRFKAGFVGCLDLPVKRVHAKLWRRVEPVILPRSSEAEG